VKDIEMARIEDYEIGESYDLKLKKTSSITLTRSNVLKIIFSDSGTKKALKTPSTDNIPCAKLLHIKW